MPNIPDPLFTGIGAVPLFPLRLTNQISVNAIIITYFCVIIIWIDAISRKSLIRKFPTRVTKIILTYAGLNVFFTILFVVLAYTLDNKSFFTVATSMNAGQAILIESMYLVRRKERKKNLNFFFFLDQRKIFLLRFWYQVTVSKSNSFRSSRVVKRITFFTIFQFFAGTISVILFLVESVVKVKKKKKILLFIFFPVWKTSCAIRQHLFYWCSIFIATIISSSHKKFRSSN